MAAVTGTLLTYNLNVGIKLDFEDAIYLISPSDVPLQAGSDMDGRSTISSSSATEVLVQWQDEVLLLPTSTIPTAINSTSAVTFTVATGDGIKFQAGHIVLVEAESMRVTGVAGDVLTVTRSYGGSTAATHNTNNLVVKVTATALPEGSNPQPARATDRSVRTNNTQILGPYAIQTSGTQDAVQKYGLATTEFDHQVGNRLKEVGIEFEQSLIYGKGFIDNTNQWRTMNGLINFITTNVDSTTTVITESTLRTQLQAVYDAGGRVDRLLVGSKQKTTLSQVNSAQIRYTGGETTRGQIIDQYQSDFGTPTIVMDRWVRTPDLFGFSRDQFEQVVLRPLHFEMLAKTGDATQGQIVAEKSCKFRKQQHAFAFSALT